MPSSPAPRMPSYLWPVRPWPCLDAWQCSPPAAARAIALTGRARAARQLCRLPLAPVDRSPGFTNNRLPRARVAQPGGAPPLPPVFLRPSPRPPGEIDAPCLRNDKTDSPAPKLCCAAPQRGASLLALPTVCASRNAPWPSGNAPGCPDRCAPLRAVRAALLSSGKLLHALASARHCATTRTHPCCAPSHAPCAYGWGTPASPTLRPACPQGRCCRGIALRARQTCRLSAVPCLPLQLRACSPLPACTSLSHPPSQPPFAPQPCARPAWPAPARRRAPRAPVRGTVS